MQLRANRRADAVGADEDVSQRGRAIRQRQPHARAVGVEAHRGVIDLHGVRPQRVEQRTVERRPKDDARQIAFG